MKWIVLFSCVPLFFGFVSCSVSGDSGRSGSEIPEVVDVEPADSSYSFESVRAAILEAVEKKGVPSIAVAVARNGEIVWEAGFGWADRQKNIPATPRTGYHLASISKAMTATGLMVLVERGLVDLDGPANDYLGEAKLTSRAGDAREATVGHLVSHTAGLPMHWNLFLSGGRPDMDESIRRYGFIVTPPGERYNYSNFGYGVIGHIISRVSGREYGVFMREEVFGPLGMTSASVLVDPDPARETAVMYGPRGGRISPPDYDHRGASAILSSVHDLVRFGLFHLSAPLPEQRRILEDGTIERMHSEVGARFMDGGRTVDYLMGGFGGVDYGGYRFEVASGSMPVGGAEARLTLVPSEKIVTALACNGSGIDLWSIERRIFEAMLPGFAEEAAALDTVPPAGDEVDPVPPRSFQGGWSGVIETYAGEIPAEMEFGDGISMKIGGRRAAFLGYETPLGKPGFQGGFFRGLFMGAIDTPDAGRARHVLFVECRISGGRIEGAAMAIAMDRSFCLPYRMSLERVDR